jgi:hypothetical protein
MLSSKLLKRYNYPFGSLGVNKFRVLCEVNKSSNNTGCFQLLHHILYILLSIAFASSLFLLLDAMVSAQLLWHVSIYAPKGRFPKWKTYRSTKG